MINLLRKIRLKFLSEYQTSSTTGRLLKYLFYAMGEIVLVVIGILIALQINNWNIAHQTKMWEQRFLKDLNNELKANLESIKRVESIQGKVGEALLSFIHVIENNRYRQVNIDSLYGVVQTSNPTFFPTKAVYQTSLADGKIESLENDHLKYEIMNLYNRYFDRIIYNGEILDAVVEKVDWDILKYYNSRQGRFTTVQINNPDLLNILDYHLEQNQVYLSILNATIEQIENLIKLIDHPIK